ncbi:MAG: metalloregulator ArsR/SmtB family transcription factor [Candidatus Peregrinibacteria bacterium]|nr:metalloregulator ArsR/SmtB family transcription factor [Candidatus Peregrinibacteria bacterium]
MLRKKNSPKIKKLFNEKNKDIVAVFKALSDVNRYHIFCILMHEPNCSVSEIAEILGISLPLTSQHIKILTLNNLLQKEREGKKIIPKLEKSNPLVKAIIKILQQTSK